MNLPAIRSYAALVPWAPPTPARRVADSVEPVVEPVQVLDAGQSGVDSAPPPFEPGGKTLGRFIDTWA